MKSGSRGGQIVCRQKLGKKRVDTKEGVKS